MKLPVLLLTGLALVIAASASSHEDKRATENAENDTSKNSFPAKHLSTAKIDLPEKYKMESQNGMRATVRDYDGGVDVLLAFGGYRHVSGAVRLTRIMLRFPRGKNVLSLSDCKAIYYDRADVKDKTLDCMNGYLVLDRDNKKLEIDFIVFDDRDWRRFGWNGVWNIELDPKLNTEDLLENMGITPNLIPKQ